MDKVIAENEQTKHSEVAYIKDFDRPLYRKLTRFNKHLDGTDERPETTLEMVYNSVDGDQNQYAKYVMDDLQLSLSDAHLHTPRFLKAVYYHADTNDRSSIRPDDKFVYADLGTERGVDTADVVKIIDGLLYCKVALY